MNYHRIYDEFIHDRIFQEYKLEGLLYYEVHHIIPRALDGPDHWLNLVKLSPSDHIFAHLLLAKIFGGPMVTALNIMMNCNQYKGRATRKIYQSNREKFAEQMSGENNPMYGKTGENNPNYGRKHTEESLEKKSISMIGKNAGANNWMYGRTGENCPNYGMKRSEEFKEKRSVAYNGENNPMYGKKHTEEALEKMRGENHHQYGKKRSKETKEKMNATRLKNIDELIGDQSKYTEIDWQEQ